MPKKKINKEKSFKVLAIDLSIGKVKLCLLVMDTLEKKIAGGWSSLPVKFEQTGPKEFEFTEGLSIALEAFLRHHQTELSEIKEIVFCTGGALYMFRDFISGLHYIGGILKMLFPRQKIFFARCDGKFTALKEIYQLEPLQASAYGCTNFVGTSLLAAKLFPNGLAVDMGTISTSIIPIVKNELDPVAALAPEKYMLHRYTTGKHLWFGAMHTPLFYITNQVETDQGKYNLILRSCDTSTLCSLFSLLPAEVANPHVNKESSLPEKDLALRNLAETIGLDINSIPPAELMAIARQIYFQMLFRLSENFRSILAAQNYENFSELKVLVSGLGQEAFILPVLRYLGFAEKQIIKIAENKESNLWTAASVYGLAIKSLEGLSGETIEISTENG